MRQQPDPSKPPAAAVPPLTHSGARKGRYKRRADVENEIRQALQLHSANWLAHAPEKGGWSDETRVHLIRRLGRNGDRAIFGALLYILMKRAGRIVQQWAQGFEETDFQQIADKVAVNIAGRLLAPKSMAAGEILEVCFSTVVRNETLKEVEKIQRRRDVNLPAPVVQTEDGEIIDPTAFVRNERPDPLEELIESRESRPTIRELLRAVTDPRHRRAFVLRKIRKWPYQPGNPPKPCLCDTFKVSERRIRTWIGIACDEMRKAFGDRT